MEQKKHFDGTEGAFIEVERSKKMTARFREKNPDHEIKAHFFGCDVIQDILDDPRCKGIRIYYALDEENKPKVVIVGADKNMDNILYRTPITRSVGAAAGGGLPGTADESHDCPSLCGKNDEL